MGCLAAPDRYVAEMMMDESIGPDGRSRPGHIRPSRACQFVSLI